MNDLMAARLGRTSSPFGIYNGGQMSTDFDNTASVGVAVNADLSGGKLATGILIIFAVAIATAYAISRSSQF